MVVVWPVLVFVTGSTLFTTIQFTGTPQVVTATLMYHEQCMRVLVVLIKTCLQKEKLLF